MSIKSGVDIVSVERMRRSLASSSFIQKTFDSTELVNPSAEHLAGIFAAKEAVMKALDIPAGNWKDIVISKNQVGKPSVELLLGTAQPKDCSLSISHDSGYAVALFVCITEESSIE